MVFKKYESESAAPLNNNLLPQTSAPNNNNDFLMSLAYVPPPDGADTNSPLDTPASSKFECYTILCQNMVTQRDHMDNPLPWWKVSTFGFILIVMRSNVKLSLCQACAHEFPIISHIAHDYLAISGTIISVKQLFSKSCHLCTNQHSPLKAKTIMETMCTKEWL